MSASNPVLRDYHEYILVFSKESYSKNKAQEKRDTITHDDFIDWTRSLWTFPAVNAKRIGHPAQFPIELPHRLINLYSYGGMLFWTHLWVAEAHALQQFKPTEIILVMTLTVSILIWPKGE